MPPRHEGGTLKERERGRLGGGLVGGSKAPRSCDDDDQVPWQKGKRKTLVPCSDEGERDYTDSDDGAASSDEQFHGGDGGDGMKPEERSPPHRPRTPHRPIPDAITSIGDGIPPGSDVRDKDAFPMIDFGYQKA